jgi:hypothetical protein
MFSDIMMRGRNSTVKFNDFCIFMGRDEYASVSFLSPRKGKSAPVRFKGNVNDLIDLFEEVARELRSMEKENGVD